MADSIVWWGNGVVSVALRVDRSEPVALAWAGPSNTAPAQPAETSQALVEVFAVGHGHANHNLRHTASAIGRSLRLVSTADRSDGRWSTLEIRQHDPETGLDVTSTLRAPHGCASLQCWTEVRNDGPRTLVLQAVSSLACGVLGGPEVEPESVDAILGVSEWLAEGRWDRAPVLAHTRLVDVDRSAHQGHDSRGRVAWTSRGTWSTGERIPCGVIVDRAGGAAWAWQIEHNGGWLAEISTPHGTSGSELVLGLFGPTDAEHQWMRALAPGEAFVTVPVSVAFAASGWQEAVHQLTCHRRAIVARDSAPQDLPVVFNDYMNTLMGDPTTEKIVPLIEAAADVGAEYFCIDAGWYDDSGDWWDSVGEWAPSRERFRPDGLGAVLDLVRRAGMVPGLWLEPEVIGVRSPMVDRLPADAFFQRHGEPVIEQGRMHLDLRHPAARAHLDSVVDRLVEELGVGYLKLDYNITPGQGTDVAAHSPGDGLLGHNRAHLRWLDGVAERHPGLLLENCASGGMRADYAMLARMHLQSTSDQQNPLLYPPIAASAPMSVLPEQAGNWAYPQPGMSAEEITFTLATGVLGRLYLSGHLDGMNPEQRRLVRSAVSAHKRVRESLGRSRPTWPLGLPRWTDDWVALGLIAEGDDTYVCRRRVKTGP